MSIELKKGLNNCYVVEDSHANNHEGLYETLDFVESQDQCKKKTIIFLDMASSEESNSEIYRNISAILNDRKIVKFIGVGKELTKARKAFPSQSAFFNNLDHLFSEMPLFQNEMIIVKGSNNFERQAVLKKLHHTSHGTTLEVNFDAIRSNLNTYRELITENTKVMVMVKANAYGSGIIEVSNFLQHEGVEMLGVAYTNQAIQLRKNGIHIPIMVMNPHIESFEDFELHDLQPEIFSLSHLDRLLLDTVKHPKIHLKIDSGMHRLGFQSNEIDGLVQRLKENPDLIVAGVLTHFASADSPLEDEFTKQQAHVFNEAYDRIVEAIGYSPTKHACNSSAIARWPQYHFDMVRLGIGLYGFDPTDKLSLNHTAALKSIISQVQNLKAGDTVGYSRKGKILSDSKIAIVPIGYEDGYQRTFGNGNGFVSINGILCPTVGNICMDMIMVDVTNANAEEGDEVVIFGEQPTIQDLANWANTIPYEILTNVSNRVERIFVSN